MGAIPFGLLAQNWIVGAVCGIAFGTVAAFTEKQQRPEE